ncbi:MAG: WecB/TagA/CpsF family glycosyltransferase [Bacteroidota bacterium]
MSAKSTSTRILNIEIYNSTQAVLLEELTSGIVFTPNVDHFVRLQNDYHFYNAYKNANYVLLDSKIIFSLYNLGGKRIQEKISGVDFFPEFCRYHAKDNRTKVFLLGGLDDSVHRAGERLNKELGSALVVGSYSGKKGFENDEIESQKVVNIITQSQANVLAVGIGSPQQELWIAKYKFQLPNVNIFFAVGGTFDVLSGKRKRAPVWMQNAGLEWLYRLLQEPRRLFKRYVITDMKFFYYFFLERLHLYKNPFGD